MRNKVNARKFHFFTGDRNWLSYGGTWARHISGLRFHFLLLTNMDDACGRDNIGHPTYSIELREVDLAAVDPQNIADAMRSCGGIEDADALAEFIGVDPLTGGIRQTTAREMLNRFMRIACAVQEYVLHAPLSDVSTDNAYEGLAELRKESYRLERDSVAYEEKMSRPVNRMGSTAREYARGDFTSGLVRGIEAGDVGAGIVGRMYRACGWNTLGGILSENAQSAISGALEGKE